MLSKLYETPLDLALGDTVKVKVVAQSNYGDSLKSIKAEKLLAFKPRAPLNVEEDASLTSST